MLNQVTLIGNVGQAPVLREANGGTFATFSLATTKYWKDDAGEKHEDTQWHSCVLWRKDLSSFLDKVGTGTGLFVQGELFYRHSDEDGVRRTWATIRVHRWRVLSGRAASTATEAEPASDDDADEAEATVA